MLNLMSFPAFNRMLAKHLAQALRAGTACDEALVLRCYSTARRDVASAPSPSKDPLILEAQALCVAHDLQALQRRCEQLRRLPLHEAESAILQMLDPDLRISPVRMRPTYF
jgi:hypothetical protein